MTMMVCPASWESPVERACSEYDPACDCASCTIVRNRFAYANATILTEDGDVWFQVNGLSPRDMRNLALELGSGWDHDAPNNVVWNTHLTRDDATSAMSRVLGRGR